MPKTISANEAKNRLGSVLGYVSDDDDEVIVESYGKPKAVVMSISAYEEVQAMREQRRRAQAFNELRALRAEVQAQNRDLTQKEADEIANRFSHEMFDDMAARGDIVFERDLR
jgi:prevent-host-death family protein